jgi:poly(A) polymerase
MTRDHLVLGFMVREMPLPPRRVWDYLRRTGELSIDTTLLTVADRLSAQGGGVPDEAIEGHLALARELLAAAVELRRDGAPEPLLRGDGIAAALGIEPGPRLGEAVDELAAAQYAGEVTDREAAVAHLRGWAASR